MTQEFLPFSRPSISQGAIDEVVECLKSGWITTGPRVKQFETALQDYVQAPHLLALTSGTAGLHLALKALDLQPGDEVVTTSMTFVASLNSIIIAGGRPVLVDVDETYNMDVSQLEQAITPRTRAIMPVHFAGLPVDLDPVYALAEKHQLRVIEDAAQAIGSFYKNKIIGSFGDTQVFSFHPNKNMTTGEGGAVATRDEKLAKAIAVLRFHGIDRDAFNRFAKNGSQYYDVIEPGFKYNMLDLQAALGLHQIKEIENFTQKRAHLAERYNALLADWPQLTLPKVPHYDHRANWHLYAPLINTETAGMTRDEFMQKMQAENIGTGLHYQAVHLFTYYREKFGFKKNDFPRAENIAERIVSLPLYPGMTDQDQDRVIAAMAKVFGRRS